MLGREAESIVVAGIDRESPVLQEESDHSFDAACG